jgi:hypothetical protein
MSCAVLVVSCDSYSDVWTPFFTMFRKCWGDCPYPTYLLTNTKDPRIEGVQTLVVGADVSWSDNLISALQNISEEYVFIMLEDLILTKSVQTDKVQEVVEWAHQHKANYVRMNPTVRADKPHNSIVGYISKGTVYRASVVMPLFRKQALLELLKSGENAWEFEYFGSQRADEMDDFYATHYDYFPCVNGIIKGVWEYSALKTLQKSGAPPDTSVRRVMNVKERIIWKVKVIRTFIFQLLPPLWRRKVKELFAGKRPAM